MQDKGSRYISQQWEWEAPPTSCEYEAEIQQVPLPITVVHNGSRQGHLIKAVYVLMTRHVTYTNEGNLKMVRQLCGRVEDG